MMRWVNVRVGCAHAQPPRVVAAPASGETIHPWLRVVDVAEAWVTHELLGKHVRALRVQVDLVPTVEQLAKDDEPRGGHASGIGIDEAAARDSDAHGRVSGRR